MSANAHTAVMTDLEQRIQDGRQLSAPRPRINRIMEDRFYGRKPRVDIQRAVLFTQSMMQTEAYPQVLRTALAIQYMMEHIEVVIQPHELIVGTAGGPGRYCVLYPETRGGQFPRDLPKILKAEGKAGYAMTQAEVDTVLNEVVPYWKGKTSHELYLNMLPRETRRVIYGDEEYATQGLIFDEANNAHTLSWTGSYEKVIREGLEHHPRAGGEEGGHRGQPAAQPDGQDLLSGRRDSLLQGHDYICPPLCGQGRGDGRGGERPGTPGRAGDHRGDLPPCARAPRPELL